MKYNEIPLFTKLTKFASVDHIQDVTNLRLTIRIKRQLYGGKVAYF